MLGPMSMSFFFQYYNSKGLKEDNPTAALESFERVLVLENGEKGNLTGILS